MTESRVRQHHPKVQQEKLHHGAVRAKRRTEALAGGAAAYREEFERDNGPDLDEPLDGTEATHEF